MAVGTLEKINLQVLKSFKNTTIRNLPSSYMFKAFFLYSTDLLTKG